MIAAMDPGVTQIGLCEAGNVPPAVPLWFMLRAIRGAVSGRGPALALVLSVVAGCAATPRADSLLIPATMRSVAGSAPVHDGRARFREIFCSRLSAVAGSSGDTDCEQWLWRLPDERLSDETASQSKRAGGKPLDQRLRIVMIGGAFSDCYPEAGKAFAGAAESLSRQGYFIETVPVSGRSSSHFNAQQIGDFLSAMPAMPDRPLVLVGYSKGASDILEMLRDFPELTAQVAAVVSIAGSINGSPLADRYAPLYDRFVSRRRLLKCPAGDGGVMDSLKSSTRLEWLAREPLPPGIRYYSMGTFTTPDRLARALTYPSRLLSRIDARNDGQLLAEDELIPGSTLLGYAHADHWAVALHIEDALPFWAHRRQGVHAFPQDTLLESILIYVQQDVLPNEE